MPSPDNIFAFMIGAAFSSCLSVAALWLSNRTLKKELDKQDAEFNRLSDDYSRRIGNHVP